MMSNHHVLAVPTRTSGQDIETVDPDSSGASWTHTADLQAWRNNETFDYALGLYRNDTDCQPMYRSCADGTTRGFAGDFAEALSVNDVHFKVGLTTRCTTGRLLGVGNIGQVGGIDRRGQLIFERMTQPGDSGSIVVHEETNRIVGLHFAGFDDPVNPTNSRSFSNPIYRVGLQLVGYYELLSGERVPVYDASKATIPVTPEQSVAADLANNFANSGELELLSDVSRRSAELIGGLLYLGALHGHCSDSGVISRVSGTEPLPVSGGDIVRIAVNLRPHPFLRNECLVLYFG